MANMKAINEFCPIRQKWLEDLTLLTLYGGLPSFVLHLDIELQKQQSFLSLITYCHLLSIISHCSSFAGLQGQKPS